MHGTSARDRIHREWQVPSSESSARARESKIMRLPLLALHISAGIIGPRPGAAAILFRKGSERRRAAGNAFVVPMLIMGLCASYLALLKHQMNNFFGGLLTFYMVVTAWLTARRRANEPGVLDWVAFLFAIAVGASVLTLGVLVANGKAGPQVGVPIGMYSFLWVRCHCSLPR